MRFYFGFSKRIPIKWIIGALLGVLAFFGLTKVHALELTDLTYIGSADFGNTDSLTISCNASLDSRLWTFSNRYTNNYDNAFLVINYSNKITAADGSPQLIDYNPGAFTIYDSNNTQSFCDYHPGYIICPMTKGRTYTGLRFQFLNPWFPCGNNAGSSTYSYNTYRWGFVYVNGQANQQQQIIDNQQQTNDFLNDDNTSESSSSADDFFSDFQVSDTKGITSVITAPIVFLQNLMTYSPNSCNPLTFDLTMKDDNLNQTKALSFPCGSVLWSRAPSAVVALYSAMIWGLLGYRVLIGLNKFYNDIFNPESISEYYLDL